MSNLVFMILNAENEDLFDQGPPCPLPLSVQRAFNFSEYFPVSFHVK